MGSKSILFVCLLGVVLMIASEVTARNLDESMYHRGGGGGGGGHCYGGHCGGGGGGGGHCYGGHCGGGGHCYGGHCGGGGGGGGCHYGCCGHGYHGGCRCCKYAGEPKDAGYN